MAKFLSESLSESYWPADHGEPLLEITLGDLLRLCAAETPERVALVVSAARTSAPNAQNAARRFTYRELLVSATHRGRARESPACGADDATRAT